MGEGVRLRALIDGRNRLAACRMAGVEPLYASLNGHDPVAYILSANVARRNLTKGQRARAVARINSLISKELTWGGKSQRSNFR